MPRTDLAGALLLLAAIAGAREAGAQTPTTLERVVLDRSGSEQRLFDTPFAVSVIETEQLRNAGPMVNLSEALQRVPGIVANQRYNYAQDLQLSSRGFGARATFGVRGLRLYSDGIPASGPDGQGQVSHFDLAGAQRIEVLRGPFSALYGNSSGGAILLQSTAPTERRLMLDGDMGSNGQRQWRLGVELPATAERGFSLRAQLSRFETDGFRRQSASRRDLANVRLAWDGVQDRVVLTFNAIDQPAQDPLGLTRAQLTADPQQTTAVALPQDEPGEPDRFNTRKSTEQQQIGASWRHRFVDAGALSQALLSAYLGRREVTQWQSIPVATQANERQPGGVIAFEREYYGIDGRLVWQWALAEERRARLVLGATLDDSNEDRRGYENFSGPPETRLLGVTGRLRRDERNRLGGRDAYAQADLDLSASWQASLGVRSGETEFKSNDRYVVGANPDDSGTKTYRYTNPFAALQWRSAPTLNTYLSLGQGFESPTQGELAYRSDGQAGFNSGLKAQTSRQIELGAKWRPGPLSLDAALFKADSKDEIGVATNTGGRATYRNVGRTQREGAELDLRWQIARSWRSQFALSWLDARYRDGFTTCASAPCTTPTLLVAPGRRIAGTISRSAYGELAWDATASTQLALETRLQGRQPVNDVNSDYAAGYGLVNLRARWLVPIGTGRLELLGRVDNVADRDYVSSVIVNEGNGRFFEPAPGRTWLLSARWSQPW
jgi:iron complex outermembrane receptor protein